MFKLANIQYDSTKHSLWQQLAGSVYDSTKEGHQLLIKDLLDSHDTLKENHENVLKKFTDGKRIDGHEYHVGAEMKVSKRGLKAR